MARYRLNIKTCCLYVILESKIKFGQKFFASPKISTPVHLCISYKRLRTEVQIAQTNGVERVKRFVNARLYCIVSTLKRIGKISALLPEKHFVQAHE